MLGRLSNLMNQTLEALAPSQSNLDDFEFHWRATTGYFLENRDAKAPLKSTAIPGDALEMAFVLSLCPPASYKLKESSRTTIYDK